MSFEFSFKSGTSAPDEGTSWLDFISNMSGNLAWPLAAFAICLMFRSQIQTLLGRMTKASGLGVEAEFESGLTQAAENAEEVIADAPAQPIDQQDAMTATTRDNIKFARLAESSPAAAILQKWAEIEIEIGRRAAPYGKGAAVRRLISAPRQLVDLGVIDMNGMKLLNDLKSLRNVAAHPADSPDRITTDQALRFGEIADQFISSLRLVS